MTTTSDPAGTTYPEMFVRAQARGGKVESFDPNHLIQEVIRLLESNGLHLELTDEPGRRVMADIASHRLLRALGINPAGGVEYIDRVNAPDPESR